MAAGARRTRTAQQRSSVARRAAAQRRFGPTRNVDLRALRRSALVRCEADNPQTLRDHFAFGVVLRAICRCSSITGNVCSANCLTSGSRVFFVADLNSETTFLWSAT